MSVTAPGERTLRGAPIGSVVVVEVASLLILAKALAAATARSESGLGVAAVLVIRMFSRKGWR